MSARGGAGDGVGATVDAQAGGTALLVIGASALAEPVPHGLAVTVAESLCEGVRRLLAAPVALVVVDGARLRLAPPQQAALFARVAPGVPVVVVVDRDGGPGHARALERVGFTVRPAPLTLDALAALVAAAPRARGGPAR